ncbi:MAG: hypothetical protein PHG23_00845 [Candidatus Pacebacteria bacterium]|nr:hypothetical protein [Candidatus Paceibacterota bacterium]
MKHIHNLAISCLALAVFPLCGFSIFAQNQEITPDNKEQFIASLPEKELLISKNQASEQAQEQKKERILVIITAYSSTVDQTDEDPFITASGALVRDGIVANNLLPFGTKIRIPDLYGEKEFIVADRMNPSRSDYHIDIWFPSRAEAKNFGIKKAYIEVSKS